MKQLIFVLLILFLNGCAKPVFISKWVDKKSPETFVTRFETSKGSFDIRVMRNSSPLAVDRFYQLIVHHFYDNAVFYRVVPGFVVQFGISDTVRMNYWKKYKIPDEKVVSGNIKGSLSYARSGFETRGTELFINLNDNARLDTVIYEGVKGFPTFGEVIRGMEVVESIYSGYSNSTMNKLDTMYLDRSRFIDIFPKLDLIHKAYILKEK